MKTRAQIASAKRIVLKVGSSVLSRDDAPVFHEAFFALARDVAGVRATGRLVVVVSSGAVALGVARLGLAVRPVSIHAKQAVAAVGQGALMHQYAEAFAVHGMTVAQVLLTHDDLRDRRRFLNARRTFQELFELGVIPIVNENDTVAFEEIQFGDNDRLAALVTNVVEAGLLVLLTDCDGVFDRDPAAPGAKRISVVHDVSEVVKTIDFGKKSRVGTGGMPSKLEAAQTASEFGVATAIVNGHEPHAIRRLLAGDDVGTVVLPSARSLGARKHWIAFGASPAGTIHVDAGAKRALVKAQKSLLPSGITRCEGAFEMGDAVRIVGPDGVEFARGLVNYASADVARIAGKKTTDIERILGTRTADEVVHRDDLVTGER
ncbi:MAG: glutamate 5-kinase [Deltaproteobacteria bacterium]|nr:glutamate 5-kinase [Deltaproteobacteria bacterium]